MIISIYLAIKSGSNLDPGFDIKQIAVQNTLNRYIYQEGTGAGLFLTIPFSSIFLLAMARSQAMKAFPLILLIFAYSILTTEKWPLIIAINLFLSVKLVFLEKYIRSMNLLQILKSGSNKPSLIMFFGISIGLIIFYFAILTLFDSRNILSGGYTALDHVANYHLGGFCNLSQWIDNQPMLATISETGLRKIFIGPLSFFGYADRIGGVYDLIDENFVNGMHNNVYTGIRPYVESFGQIGSYILLSVILLILALSSAKGPFRYISNCVLSLSFIISLYNWIGKDNSLVLAIFLTVIIFLKEFKLYRHS
jgi:hypothetical protein